MSGILVPENSAAALAAQAKQARLMNVIGLGAQIFSQTMAHRPDLDVAKTAAQALIQAGTFWMIAESLEKAEAEPTKPLVAP